MKKCKLCFVILHYLACDETIRCIRSIQDKCRENYRIIVVDNHSDNGTGAALRDVYEDDDLVDVVLLEENLGFANGNNRGIEYARKKYNPLFICCMNNDTELLSAGFIDMVEEEWQRSYCAIMGPMLITGDGRRKAYEKYPLTEEEIRRQIAFYQHAAKQSDSPEKKEEVILSAKDRLYRMPLGIGFLMRFQRDFRDGLFKRTENVILHGSCLIFTPVFFEHYSGFDQRTFLYGEEALLYIMCQKKHLMTVYQPKLRVRHTEDAATNMAVDNNVEKRMLKSKYMTESLQIVLLAMSGNDDA